MLSSGALTNWMKQKGPPKEEQSEFFKRLSALTEKKVQKILVFQQDNNGHSKVKGIERHAKDLVRLDIISIDEPLPPVLDDTGEYLSSPFEADLVLDFLTHPDLSLDLAVLCRNKKIPLVASGKKLRIKWAHTPPT